MTKKKSVPNIETVHVTAKNIRDMREIYSADGQVRIARRDPNAADLWERFWGPDDVRYTDAGLVRRLKVMTYHPVWKGTPSQEPLRKCPFCGDMSPASARGNWNRRA